MDVRVLIGDHEGTDLELATLYAPPRLPWLRANMISTVDGAATGETGTSGSINNAADKRVFDHLRASADVVVVGAGTARAEGYGEADRPIVVVSRRGDVPPTLRGAAPGRVLLATCATAPHLEEARDLLGAEHVRTFGTHRVDLVALRRDLEERGHRSVLCEGGPHLLREMLAVGVVDELCATVVPRLVGGAGPRILVGQPVDVPLELGLLLEDDGTLLARWWVQR